MSVTEWLVELGGVATRGTLVRLTSREELDRAVAGGDVVRVARGRYGLPGLDEAVRMAVAVGGAVSHASAALHHGWAVREVPAKPQVTVSRGRRVDPALAERVDLHFAELAAEDVVGHVVVPDVAMAMCLRRLPFADALAIADSGLREGFGPVRLGQLADAARGPGSPQVRRVADLASPLAANPFESALRAIAADVPGLDVRPQVEIRLEGALIRPDLVDELLRIVLEADSFEWHGGREQLAADARRYNLLTVEGWLVLRFAWEDVMHDPAYVRVVLEQAVSLAQMLNKVGSRRGRVA